MDSMVYSVGHVGPKDEGASGTFAESQLASSDCETRAPQTKARRCSYSHKSSPLLSTPKKTTRLLTSSDLPLITADCTSPQACEVMRDSAYDILNTTVRSPKRLFLNDTPKAYSTPSSSHSVSSFAKFSASSSSLTQITASSSLGSENPLSDAQSPERLSLPEAPCDFSKNLDENCLAAPFRVDVTPGLVSEAQNDGTLQPSSTLSKFPVEEPASDVQSRSSQSGAIQNAGSPRNSSSPARDAKLLATVVFPGQQREPDQYHAASTMHSLHEKIESVNDYVVNSLSEPRESLHASQPVSRLSDISSGTPAIKPVPELSDSSRWSEPTNSVPLSKRKYRRRTIIGAKERETAQCHNSESHASQRQDTMELSSPLNWDSKKTADRHFVHDPSRSAKESALSEAGNSSVPQSSVDNDSLTFDAKKTSTASRLVHWARKLTGIGFKRSASAAGLDDTDESGGEEAKSEPIHNEHRPQRSVKTRKRRMTAGQVSSSRSHRRSFILRTTEGEGQNEHDGEIKQEIDGESNLYGLSNSKRHSTGNMCIATRASSRDFAIADSSSARPSTRLMTKLNKAAPPKILVTKFWTLGDQDKTAFTRSDKTVPRELLRLRDTNEYAGIETKPVITSIWANGKPVDIAAQVEQDRVTRIEAEKRERAAKTANQDVEMINLDEGVLTEDVDKERPAGRRRISSRVRKPSTRVTFDETQPVRKVMRKTSAEYFYGQDLDQKDSEVPKEKVYLSQGIYADQNFDVSDMLKNLVPTLAASVRERWPHLDSKRLVNKTLPLPIFAGMRQLVRGEHFQLPYGIFGPLPREPSDLKPPKYREYAKNRWTADALAIDRKEHRNDEHSSCDCTPESGCGDRCLNRVMFYECDSTNCRLDPSVCTNRAFKQLEARIKRRTPRSPFDVGVECFHTGNRGFGLRSVRTFEKNQIIVEYTGDIITVEESLRRMDEKYSNDECYYLMGYNQWLSIDATTGGGLARFVNHSCDPNCRMVRWLVAGQPRIGLFADRHIEVGDELTYDYNFLVFANIAQTCLCGSANCRGSLGPKSSKKASPVSADADASFPKSKIIKATGVTPAGSTAAASKVTTTKKAAIKGNGSAVADQKKPSAKKQLHSECKTNLAKKMVVKMKKVAAQKVFSTKVVQKKGLEKKMLAEVKTSTEKKMTMYEKKLLSEQKTASLKEAASIKKAVMAKMATTDSRPLTPKGKALGFLSSGTPAHSSKPKIGREKL